MLLQICNYIKKQGTVSTQQLAREFRLDILALQPMLEVWVNKGVIRKCPTKKPCGSSCFNTKCSTALEFYQLVF